MNEGAFRGVVLVGVAVVIGLILLASGFDDTDIPDVDDPESAVAGGGDDEGNPTEVPSGGDIDPSEIVVIVANGSGVNNAAGAVSDFLTTLGYTPLPPTNTTVDVSETMLDTVYYVESPNTQAQAERVAVDLGLTAAAVAPLPDAPPAEMGLSQVLVVLGSSPGGLAETHTATATEPTG